MESGFEIRVFKRISDFNNSELKRIFELSEAKNSDRNIEWIEIVENSCSKDIFPYYFLVYKGEKIVGLFVGMIALKMDFEYKSFEGIDKGPVNIIKLDTLLCNFPLSNFHGFFFEDNDNRKVFFKGFFKEIAENLKPEGIFFGPIEENEVETYEKMIPVDFIKIPYLAVAYMDVDFNSFEDYLGTLKKKYRWDVKNKIKIFEESGAIIEYCENSFVCADKLLSLFNNTAENNPEFKIPFHFTSQFFQEISKYLGRKFEIILVKKKENIIAFGLVLKTRNIIELKFIGLDHDFSEKSAAYFNIFFEVIRLAIKSKFKKIYFGATSLYNKKRIGCKVMNQFVYMGSYPLEIFRMFKKSGILEKKFIQRDYFTREDNQF